MNLTASTGSIHRLIDTLDQQEGLSPSYREKVFAKGGIFSEILKFWKPEFEEKLMTTLQIRGKGTITLPAHLRKKTTLKKANLSTLLMLEMVHFF